MTHARTDAGHRESRVLAVPGEYVASRHVLDMAVSATEPDENGRWG
jgi:hypothetical protein